MSAAESRAVHAVEDAPVWTRSAMEVHANSSKYGVFTTEDVQRNIDSLHRVGIPKKLTAWQEQDRAGKHPGGRKPDLNHVAVLVALLLLGDEHSPRLTTEMANVFHRRLTDEARVLLGIDHVKVTGDPATDAKDWYFRTDRAFHRLVDLFDAYPARRQIMNKGERAYQAAQRDPADQRVRLARFNWLGNQLLEMTVRELPKAALDSWGGGASFDQTKVAAVSKRGRKRWPKRNGARIGPEPEGLIMEFDADWAAHNPDLRGGADFDPNQVEYTWGYLAGIVVMARDDPDAGFPHPALAIAMSFGAPNNGELPEHSVAMLASIRERGHPAGRVVGDLEYFALQKPERLLLPVKALGYEPITGYRPQQLGKPLGTLGGALIVEGKAYCPAMKQALVEATTRHSTGKITNGAYRQIVNTERPQWEVQIKQQPDERGVFQISCPARGLAPTLDCPLVDRDATATKNKVRPLAKPGAGPHDRICTQTRVTVHPDESIRYLQKYTYKSDEWELLHGNDRAAVENINGIIKDGGKEDLKNTARRRARGRTAAGFFTVLALVSANRRLTLTWLEERERYKKAPEKEFVRNRHAFRSLKDYVPRSPMLNDDGTITFPGEVDDELLAS